MSHSCGEAIPPFPIPGMIDEKGTDLFPVMKTFIVVVTLRNTFPLSLITGGVCVHDVTGQEILPERKALGQ